MSKIKNFSSLKGSVTILGDIIGSPDEKWEADPEEQSSNLLPLAKKSKKLRAVKKSKNIKKL